MSSTKMRRVFSPVVLFHNDTTLTNGIPQPTIDEYKEKIALMMEHNAKLWSSKTATPLENDIYVSPSTSTTSTESSARSCDSIPTIDGPLSPTPTHSSSTTSSSSSTSSCTPKKRRRGNLPKQVTEFLKRWLVQHKKHPYPSEKEKLDLARQTGLSVHQISNWFINARRRILQPMLESEAHVLSHARPLDIYAYQGFADTCTDDTRQWAFRRTKLAHFDMNNGYSVAIS